MVLPPPSPPNTRTRNPRSHSLKLSSVRVLTPASPLPPSLAALARAPQSNETVASWFARYDSDHDGKVSLRDMAKVDYEADTRASFDAHDSDHDGAPRVGGRNTRSATTAAFALAIDSLGRRLARALRTRFSGGLGSGLLARGCLLLTRLRPNVPECAAHRLPRL